MAQYVDQGVFDAGVILLASIGVIELENKKRKFDISEFINFEQILASYESIRPNDKLYRPQTIEVVDWAIHATPICITPEVMSGLYRSTYEIRKELNADLQPRSFKERMLRGAIFQPEAKNYLDRVSLAKSNISRILLEVSSTHSELFKGLGNLERRVNAENICQFLKRSVEAIGAALHKPPQEELLRWETKFHFACCVAARCYLSLARRIENFPTYIPNGTIHGLSTEIKNGLGKFADKHISSELVGLAYDFYIQEILSSNHEPSERSEIGIWESIGLDLTNFLYFDADGDLYDLLECCLDQASSYEICDALDIDCRQLGRMFLG